MCTHTTALEECMKAMYYADNCVKRECVDLCLHSSADPYFWFKICLTWFRKLYPPLIVLENRLGKNEEMH